MEELFFTNDFRDNDQLRESFNQLSSTVFGIDFEAWYQQGYWTEKYQPYSFVDNGHIVANVSVNHLRFVINNEIIQAIQIGTVMTHPDYRNQGLSRKLMERVLEDYQNVDLIYLFANLSVLNFYPKFGFKAHEEWEFFTDSIPIPSTKTGIRKLDGRNKEDLTFIYDLAANRLSGSKLFGTLDTEELLMFYCLMEFSKDLYYFIEEQALVIFRNEGESLHIYDVLFREEVNVEKLLSKIVNGNTRSVIFHFHPEKNQVSFKTRPNPSQHVLFIKNSSGVSLPQPVKHPFTSQA